MSRWLSAAMAAIDSRNWSDIVFTDLSVKLTFTCSVRTARFTASCVGHCHGQNRSCWRCHDRAAALVFVIADWLAANVVSHTIASNKQNALHHGRHCRLLTWTKVSYISAPMPISLTGRRHQPVRCNTSFDGGVAVSMPAIGLYALYSAI